MPSASGAGKILDHFLRECLPGVHLTQRQLQLDCCDVLEMITESSHGSKFCTLDVDPDEVGRSETFVNQRTRSAALDHDRNRDVLLDGVID